MKRIYLAVFITLMISAILFVASLFYLDKEKHKNYYFSFIIDGVQSGVAKVDKFVTDDNIFYRSRTSSWFAPVYTDSKSDITLDKRYGLINYLREDSGLGMKSTVSLENTKDNISFVGTSVSEFACLAELPVKRNTFVFEEHSPVTYLPILENYDFSIGRAQAFNVITVYSPLLPPMKRLLTLTSIRDEYMKVNSKKIKVECLLIRMKNLPQGMLYVTKTGRSLVCIEFPEKKIKIMRTMNTAKIKPEPLILRADSYSEREVKFNDKKTALFGTLTLPKSGEKLPAALLLGGPGEGDRDEQGLFRHMADDLARNGFAVMRFDVRGTGESGGSSAALTDQECSRDAAAALDYLSKINEVDPSRMIVIGHGRGALYASRLAADNKTIRSIILMAPSMASADQTGLNFDNLNEMASKYKWDEQYLKLAIKSRIETVDKAKLAKNDWTQVLGRRCFAMKLKEGLGQNQTDVIRKVECPILILHGKEDEITSAKDVAVLDKALEESGNKNHNLIYYGYLGHFFGKITEDGTHKAYYATDPAVLETVRKWADNNSQNRFDLENKL